MNAPTKVCPFCAEQILEAAIKCKHCGSDLRTGAVDIAEEESTFDRDQRLGEEREYILEEITQEFRLFMKLGFTQRMNGDCAREGSGESQLLRI